MRPVFFFFLSCAKINYSGPGVGAGPVRTTLHLAIHLMIGESDLWTQRSGRYMSLRFHSSCMVLSQRYARLQAYGFMTMLYMVNLRSGPDPVSPFLLRAVIETRARACAADTAFLRLLDPEVHQSILPWVMRDRNSPLKAEVGSAIGGLLCSVNIDVRCISCPS